MDTTTTDLKIAMIIGSVRPERFAPVVARWATERITAHGGIDLDVIDLIDIDLPAGLDGTGDTDLLRERIGAADAFVVVTPEYNHGYPGYLKTAIDSVREEWANKPLAFVSYGGLAGGARSVEQLRTVFAELHVVTVREAILFPGVWELFDTEGRLVDHSRYERAAAAMLDQLTWWGAHLRAARQVPAAVA